MAGGSWDIDTAESADSGAHRHELGLLLLILRLALSFLETHTPIITELTDTRRKNIVSIIYGIRLHRLGSVAAQ